MINDKYEYKIYSQEGKELDANICLQDGAILCKTDYYLQKDSNDCIKCPIQCSRCSYESVQNNLCLQCNNNLNYYKLYFKNNSSFLYCANEENKPDNFHLNRDQLRYEPCYETCEKCFDYGNNERNNCTTCISGYIIREENPFNCVLECKYYYYFNEYDKYRCTETNKCPDNMYLIKDKRKCVDNCKNNFPYIYQFKNGCVDKCPNNTIISENKCIYEDNGICSLIEEDLNTDIFEIMDENGPAKDTIVFDYALEHQNLNYEIFNYKNTKYNFIIYKNEDCLNTYIKQERINITKIDFKECYDLLLENYTLTEKNIIVILIDIYRQHQAPYTHYNFYHPETGQKLDSKNICSNSKVNKTINLFSMDVDNVEEKKNLISQGINIFNSSSPFFHDICFHFESPNGKDVPLKERVLLFFPNIKLCDEGCVYKGIDENKYEVICECTFSNIINNDLINNAFTGEIINTIGEMNIEVLKCFKDVFKFEYFKTNYGGIIILILIFIQIILNILYFIKNSTNIKKFTIGLINAYFYYYNKLSNCNNIINKSNEKNNKNLLNEEKVGKIKKKKALKNRNLTNPPPIRSRHYKSQRIKITNIFKNESNHNHIFPTSKNNLPTNRKQSSITNRTNSIFLQKIKTNNIISKKEDKRDIEYEDIQYMISYDELKNYLNITPDEMEYEKAKNEDKRNFCKIYNDILLNKHILLNIIYEEDKYKPRTVKLIIYLLSIDLYFVINGLFYSESYISQLYKSKEKERFFTFVPRSITRFIYSYIVIIIVNFLINFIIINGNKIKNIINKKENNDNNKVIIRGEICKILFKIERSIIIFFLVNYFIMIISWYYITCFNNVYSNTKIEWIKSSIFIILIMQLEPFVYTLGITFLRYISIHCSCEKMYKFTSSVN